MKLTQIMIIFVAAVFASVAAQSPLPTTFTGTSPAPEETNQTTVDNGNSSVTTTSDDMTSVQKTTTILISTSSVTTSPVTNNTSSESVTVATTSTPFVSTTAQPPTTTNGTEAYTTTATPCVPSGFDGASFIGGIVLALGVIVILVVIVKCYNQQSRKNELQYSQF